MIDSSKPYQEKQLQLAAIGWLVEQGRYREAFCDIEATGARMDSVGILDGRAVAIEVKVAVSSSMIRFKHGASGSLEAKLAATLEALAGPIPSWLSSFQTHWDAESYPLLVILAHRYSDGALLELRRMLDDVGDAWQFGFEIWRWTGERIEVLHSNRETVAGLVRRHDVLVPRLIGSATRAPAKTLNELREIAAASNWAEVFEAFVDGSADRHLRLRLKRSGFGIVRPGGTAECATVFVEGAGSEGLNVGVDCDWLDMPECQLPGEAAPRRGFMNTNRFLRDRHEVLVLLDLINRKHSTSN